jgi:putative two-component system response regulator
MNSFPWNPQFETGLEIVDAQHHRLVDLTNRFGELIASGHAVHSHAIADLLRELAHYAMYHFQDEELLMRQVALDTRHYDRHKAAHDEFLREVTQMQGAMATTPDAENLLRLLTHWLAYHILGTDQSMARQIRAIRQGKVAAAAFDKDSHTKDPATDSLLHALNGLFSQISQRNRDLEHINARLQAKITENQLTQQVSIRALAHLAETRDPETGSHVLRTQEYVRLIAELLRDVAPYATQLTPTYVESIVNSAPLHDIGKVGIPDAILRKPGPLDDDEFHIMRTHSALGREAIEHAEHDIHNQLPFLSTAKEITRWHHERWDGTGYPDGLRGDAIPLSARIMSVADVFDALTTRRVYREALALEDAKAHIVAERGRAFVPAIVDLMMRHFDRFLQIFNLYRDVPSETTVQRA